jgi:hypothetical protein
MVDGEPELIEFGKYHLQIEQYLPFSSPEQWLVVVFEEFTKDPVAINRSIYEFLGVDPGHVPADISPRNTTARKVHSPLWVRLARKVPFARALGKRVLPAAVQENLKAQGSKHETPEMTEDLRRRLLDVYRPEIEALSEFAHRDFARIWEIT